MDQTRHPPLRPRPRRLDSHLDHQLERRSEAVRLAQDRRPDPRQPRRLLPADQRLRTLAAKHRHPRRMTTRALRFTADARRARKAIAAQRASTARGARARRLALRAFVNYAAAGRRWAASGRARLKGQRAASRRYARAAARYARAGNRLLVSAGRLLR